MYQVHYITKEHKDHNPYWLTEEILDEWSQIPWFIQPVLVTMINQRISNIFYEGLEDSITWLHKELLKAYDQGLKDANLNELEKSEAPKETIIEASRSLYHLLAESILKHHFTIGIANTEIIVYITQKLSESYLTSIPRTWRGYLVRQQQLFNIRSTDDQS